MKKTDNCGPTESEFLKICSLCLEWGVHFETHDHLTTCTAVVNLEKYEYVRVACVRCPFRNQSLHSIRQCQNRRVALLQTVIYECEAHLEQKIPGKGCVVVKTCLAGTSKILKLTMRTRQKMVYEGMNTSECAIQHCEETYLVTHVSLVHPL